MHCSIVIISKIFLKVQVHVKMVTFHPSCNKKRILPHKRILVDGFPMLKTGKLFLSRPEKKWLSAKMRTGFRVLYLNLAFDLEIDRT